MAEVVSVERTLRCFEFLLNVFTHLWKHTRLPMLTVVFGQDTLKLPRVMLNSPLRVVESIRSTLLPCLAIANHCIWYRRSMFYIIPYVVSMTITESFWVRQRTHRTKRLNALRDNNCALPLINESLRSFNQVSHMVNLDRSVVNL